jgi:putative transposase
MPRRKQPVIPDELLDQLLNGSDPRTALADGGLLDGLKKALAERALNAELDHHLEGGEPDGRSNSRNGYGTKTVLTGTGKLDLQVPRDRLATFDPQLIAKYQRRFPGFDAKIVSMSARGMSTRAIQGHLRELYGLEVSPDLVSAVTDAVLDEVAEWQNRPLEALYPLVFLDALRVKVRDEGTVRNKAVYVALGVRPDGTKEVLGLWIEQTEGAKFWLRVMNELKDRGVEDILIAVVDGLKGFPEAISAVFPKTQVQACIVHTIRTQSRDALGRTASAWLRRPQGDDMADLQASIADDDALDQQLQDGLLVGEGCFIEASSNAVTKGSQIHPDRIRLRPLPA